MGISCDRFEEHFRALIFAIEGRAQSPKSTARNKKELLIKKKGIRRN